MEQIFPMAEQFGVMGAALLGSIYVIWRLVDMAKYRNGDRPDHRMVKLLEAVDAKLGRLVEQNGHLDRNLGRHVDRVTARHESFAESLRRLESTMVEHDRWERGKDHGRD